MKFRITTSGMFYEEEDAKRLKKLGFRFEFSKNPSYFIPPFYMLDDVKVYKDFDSIQDLINFSNEQGSPLIISKGEIKIYDDYK